MNLILKFYTKNCLYYNYLEINKQFINLYNINKYLIYKSGN